MIRSQKPVPGPQRNFAWKYPKRNYQNPRVRKPAGSRRAQGFQWRTKYFDSNFKPWPCIIGVHVRGLKFRWECEDKGATARGRASTKLHISILPGPLSISCGGKFTSENAINIGVYCVNRQARGFLFAEISLVPLYLRQDYRQNGFGEKCGRGKVTSMMKRPHNRCVLLCFIKPILGNCYSAGVFSRARQGSTHPRFGEQIG